MSVDYLPTACLAAPAPDEFNLVFLEQRIGGQNRQVFNLRLRDQQAIKGIAVMARQRRHVQRVCVCSMVKAVMPCVCIRLGT